MIVSGRGRARRDPVSAFRDVGQARYRIVVKGHLGPRYEQAFDQVTLEDEGDDTALVAAVADQAQLQGILERIAGLNLVLVSVNALDEP